MNTESHSPNNVNPEFAKAFVHAIADLSNVTKNAVNPHFRNRYATLDAILDVVRPILSKHGMAVSQEPLMEEGRCGVVTRIVHESGEVRESTLLLPVKDQTAQAAGSAITYARRYALSAVLGIAADEDDDGQEATTPEKKTAPPNPPKQSDAPPVESTVWKGTILDVEETSGIAKSGTPWTLYTVKMEGGNAASTFSEILAKKAIELKGWDGCLIVTKGRKAGTFEVLDVKPIA